MNFNFDQPKVRTAMAFEHRDPPQLNPPCYIERIPPEIANLICYSIDKEDALNLRLVSKFWNDVATPFMPSMPAKVDLFFLPESFQRLVDIPRHPVIGKQVTALYYETDTLDKYATQSGWEADIHQNRPYRRPEAHPPADASERDLRLYRRNVKKYRNSHHDCSRSQLKKAYKEYNRMCAEQEDLRNRGYGLKELSDAMSRLPKLSDICMNHRRHVCRRPRDVKYAFAAGLIGANGDHCGIPVMRSLLLAVYNAGIELDTLRLGDVNWKFLQQSDETLKRMKYTLCHLTTLHLVISTEPLQWPGEEIPTCRKYLHNDKKLSEFLAAAPKLKDLTIAFDSGYDLYCPAGLNEIFGDTVWPDLESIAMDSVDATLGEWNHFFERHASTLKNVTIGTIILRNGRWIDALEKMGQVLNLKSIDAWDHLLGENPSQHWCLRHEGPHRSRDVPTQADLTSKAVRDYLLEGGSCPLLDRVAHPQFSLIGCRRE